MEGNALPVGPGAPLVLIDIDRVLAMHRGDDCRRGAPVYHTGRGILAALAAREKAGLRMTIVTHRTRGEALCILGALGLEHWSDRLVSANDLFWQSLATMVRKRRMRGLSKAVAGDILRRRFGAYDAARSVMIDDKLSNLVRMTEARVVGFGILTPAITCDAAGVRSFDLHQVLEAAVALASGAPGSVFEVAGLETVNPDTPGILRFPPSGVVQAEPDLGTGRRLTGNPLDPVTLMRGLKSIVGRVWRNAS